MSDHHDEYNETFVAGLEWMWGAGFLSPGGSAEVAAILEGIDLRGKHVLDIGCGIGGIDILLVQEHGASKVTGIDVEAPLVARARQAVARAGLDQQIEIQLVAPGALPFSADTFDIVFSKDAIIHIPDKHALYSEMYRVLKRGGYVAFSDWFGSALPKSAEFDAWYSVLGLTFAMALIEDAAALLQSVGFTQVSYTDRNAWYANNILEEIATLEGDNYPQLVAALGTEAAAQRLRSSSLKKIVVDQGLLRPGHIRGIKGQTSKE